MSKISSTALIDAVRLTVQGGDPSSPASGYQLLYVKSGGVYVKNSSGTVTGPFGAGGGGSGFLYPMCGRLTLATGTPITTADQTAKTTVYLTPFRGDQIALYDGASTWNLRTLSEISVAVPSTTDTPFDVFCYDNAGTPTLETTDWTNDTTRATALTTQNGILVKSGATTRRYIGTGRTTGSSGQTEDSAANRLIWNYYNRVPRRLFITDATANWTYNTATWRAWNNSTANRVAFIMGYAEDTVQLTFSDQVYNSATAVGWIGINLDATTGTPNCDFVGDGLNAVGAATQVAMYNNYPGLGYHYLQLMENGGGSGNTIFYGTGTLPVGATGTLMG